MWSFKFVRGLKVRSPKSKWLIALLVVLALAQWRCGENPLQPDIRGPNEVWIQPAGFNPATLTVAVGTTVMWTNKDNVRHDVTSGLPGNVENDFDPLPALDPNANDSVVFNKRGTFNYFCLIHSGNHGTGKIIVQ